jgi:putative tricarboxylic transport membrane protein
MMHPRAEKDFYAGLLYLTLAGAFLWFGRGYKIGTAAQMGPGYFPITLACVLVALGSISLVRSFVSDGERVSAPHWRPLLLITAAGVGLRLFGTDRRSRRRAKRCGPAVGRSLETVSIRCQGTTGSHRPRPVLRPGFREGPGCSHADFRAVVRWPRPELMAALRGSTMDLFANLVLGFDTALTPINLAYALIGCFLGTAIGVLPGLGPVATIAMLLPATFGMPPVTALIMLAGIFYGAQYGGSTTAILVNLPGESSSVVTALDGYRMAREGRAGRALAIAALSSFFAGTVCTLLIALFAPPLAEVALKFGPAEYFSLMVLGLIASIVLANGSILHALAMIVVGLLLGLVGTDVNSGVFRYTFGVPELGDGIGFVLVAMGVFGIGDIIVNLENESTRDVVIKKVSGLFPTLDDLRRCFAPMVRGTALGSVLGILPGGGATLASFGAYALEKKISKNRHQFGKGAIEGVAAPEAANNAGAQMSFIPMLTLGLPSNAVMALMIGAMTIQGIQPGPSVMAEQPALFWGLIVSMWVGNLMLLILNLPLIGLWVKMISIPYRFLFPMIIVFCVIGAYSINNANFDVYTMALFGFVGYILIKSDCEPAPLLLGFILGPMMEEFLRRALILSQGDPLVLITSPISGSMLALAAILLALILSPSFSRTRHEAFQES